MTKNAFIYYKGKGRLGNHMFGVCSSLRIGEMNNIKVVFGTNIKDIKFIFPKLNIRIVHGSNWTQWKYIKENKPMTFDRKFFKLPKENISIGSFLQSYHYFSIISQQLFYNMSFINSNILMNVKHFTNYILNSSLYEKKMRIVSVCVHVRRGDILKIKHKKTGWKIVPIKALHLAMNHMEYIHQNVAFIVASVDQKWCKKHLNSKNVYFSNFTKPYYDFILMQQCDHMIMTFGSFGWWGAWITEKKGGTVMYYKNPFTKGSFINNLYNPKHYYPPNWIQYDENSVS